MSKLNTFGDYHFDEWVPEKLQESIKEFWGQMGRTHEDWLKDSVNYISQTCWHGPGPNGFNLPPHGARVMFLIKDWDSMHKLEIGDYLYKRIEGRYVHAWNNMGRVVHDDGTYSMVSSCDMWVRVWVNEQEKIVALS